VIHVTDGTNVYVRLGPRKLFFCNFANFLN
jgi:hypothetical protein